MRRYTKSQHKFFDYLVTFLGSICCLGIGLVGHRSGKFNLFYNKDRIFNIQGIATTTNLEFHFHPYGLLNSLAANIWPSSIEFEESPLSGETEGMKTPIQLSTTFMLHSQLIKSAFIHYFESFRPIIEAKYGKSTQLWPSVWNFGRVVRNAFVHNGVIYFNKRTSPSVSWKTLTYSPSDNGRQILYIDLAVVEIILLMEEMDSHL